VPLDGWLQGGAYVTATVLAALRPLLDAIPRALDRVASSYE